MRSSLEVRATLVADEFIDRYMPEANGEYVKVYLYILRHGDRQVTVVELADALNCTESDIRRALAYWERLGVLTAETAAAEPAAGNRQGIQAEPENHAGGRRGGRQTDKADFSVGTAAEETAAFGSDAVGVSAAVGVGVAAGGAVGSPAAGRNGATGKGGAAVRDAAGRGAAAAEDAAGRSTAAAGDAAGRGTAAAGDAAAGDTGGRGAAAGDAVSRGSGIPDARIPAQRDFYTPEQVRKLSEDEEFTQLLYVAQKYLNKVFTPRDCEVFAYLYDGLRLPAELLEYLVEYCVQGGHDSIRYLETVGLNWHEKGINTVERAKQYTASYSNEAFAVMRAFGLSDRRPGSSEMEMIHRWFREWGFTKDMILEACARTLAATNKPSFAYADRILMEWKKADARTMDDVRKLDEVRERARSAEAADKGGQPEQQASVVPAGRNGGQTVREGVSGSGRGTSRAAAGGSRNRFHNFEQRDTDYDAIVLRQLKERLGKQ